MRKITFNSDDIDNFSYLLREISRQSLQIAVDTELTPESKAYFEGRAMGIARAVDEFMTMLYGQGKETEYIK